MPKLTRWAIRLAMVYLVLGSVTGMLYWANNQWGWLPALSALNPIFIHLLVVGWITQLIYAVVYWMFPIINKENMRGDPGPAWAALILLNVGLVIRAICEPWLAIERNSLNQAGVLVSAILQVIAALLIVIVCWPRIRERAGK